MISVGFTLFFIVYSQLAIIATGELKFSTARMYHAFNHGQKSLLEVSVH